MNWAEWTPIPDLRGLHRRWPELAALERRWSERGFRLVAGMLEHGSAAAPDPEAPRTLLIGGPGRPAAWFLREGAEDVFVVLHPDTEQVVAVSMEAGRPIARPREGAVGSGGPRLDPADALWLARLLHRQRVRASRRRPDVDAPYGGDAVGFMSVWMVLCFGSVAKALTGAAWGQVVTPGLVAWPFLVGGLWFQMRHRRAQRVLSLDEARAWASETPTRPGAVGALKSAWNDRPTAVPTTWSKART